MRKLTTEEFIKKAREVHGEKYNYSKVEYKKAQEKVCIICPEHGEFWQEPSNHLNGCGCPECVRNSWTTEKFIQKAREVHGDKYDYSKVVFNGVRKKVCIISHNLDKHGKEIGEFWQLPLEHLNGRGCERERRGIKESCWEIRICPICHKEFKIRKKTKNITCSEECRLKYCKEHKEEINNKKSKTLKLTFSKKTKEEKRISREKAKETCLKRYGVDSFSKTEVGREISSKNMKQYKRIRDEKYKNEVLIPKYEKICEEDNLELLRFRNRFDCDVKCKQCGNVFNVKVLGYLTEETNKNLCRICHPIEQINGPTVFENTFEEFINELGVKYYKNSRSIITPYEIDFYLPDYKLGFELDGLYWHSELYKGKNYHLDKTEKCKENGVRLIHIFEDEWLYKKEIVKSRVKSILNLIENKIYARKCSIKNIDNETTKKFLEKNHIQGNTIFKYSFGLFYNEELISVMTFGCLRKNLGNKNKENCYELLRFCNKINTNVVGGASKLLSHFIKQYHPEEIISYADRRWSQGNVYEKLGFSYKHNSQPNYFYIVGDKRVNRFSFRKNILVKKYGCPIETTEREFCLSQKWYRIYDCGTKIYTLKLEN